MRDAYLLGGAIYVVAILVGIVGDGVDGHAYWSLSLDHLYPQRYGELADGFNYSPVVAQLFAPFTVLPWPVFHAVLTAANLAALYFLVGRWAVLALLFPPVAIEIFAANINLVIAGSIVLAFSWPALWAVPILTKVAPGIGVLWHVFRREWRAVAIAAAATALVVLVSFVSAPGLWGDWVAYLRTNVGTSPLPNSLAVPLVWRLPLAIALVAVAAWTSRRWLVPIALILATPVIWPATFALLLACVRLAGHGPTATASTARRFAVLRVGSGPSGDATES